MTSSSAMRSRPCSLLLTALVSMALLGTAAKAEIRAIDILMPPTDAYVHFTDGYLIAPGYIDLSGIQFTALTEALQDEDDTSFFGAGDKNDDLGIPDDLDDGFIAGEPPRRRRRLLQYGILNRNLEGGVEVGSTTIDVAVFPLPASCAGTRNGCDWTDFGIGGKLEDGTTRWCCSNDAIDFGLCSGGDDYGKLIIDDEKFDGNHRFVEIAPTGSVTKALRYGKMEEHVTGQYVVMFSNCNPNGREVAVSGETVWKSKQGYLPGELFGFMYFYLFLAFLYCVLLLWYGLSMRMNEESRIPIEKWILMTIVLGLLEMFFRTGDYMIWNEDGYRQDLTMYLGIFGGAVKRGISRCLVVMVSLGWGVVVDSLGSTMHTIVVLGAVYVGVSAAQSLMMVFAVEDMKTLSFEEEEELFDVVTILTFVVAALDVIFIMWTLDALNGTMESLENMNQSRKLMRYLRLRCIFLFSILFAVVWAIFSLVDTYDEEGIVREEQEWVVDAATEINYLFVLIALAILWRPNPSAKEYAYAMELPAMGGDDEDENDLELTAVVPSAMDDDDEEPSSGENGFHDDPDGHDERFQIDDAEPG